MQFQTRTTRFYSTLLRDMVCPTDCTRKEFLGTFPLYRMHCSPLAGMFQCNAAQRDLCSLSHFCFKH